MFNVERNALINKSHEARATLDKALDAHEKHLFATGQVSVDLVAKVNTARHNWLERIADVAAFSERHVVQRSWFARMTAGITNALQSLMDERRA